MTRQVRRQLERLRAKARRGGGGLRIPYESVGERAEREHLRRLAVSGLTGWTDKAGRPLGGR